MPGPKAPPGLQSRGRRLWRRIAALYDLDANDAELLTEACRVIDNCERLDAALRDQPLTTKGSRGQVVAHPLRADLRSERTLAAKLLAQLALPDDEEENPVTDWSKLTSSQRARRAARARWDKR
jgi:hypothetical protein